MSGHLYCTSNRDREGEYTVGFTPFHPCAVLLELDATRHAKPLRLEFARRVNGCGDSLDALVAVLSRYGRRLASPACVYAFYDISILQIHELFGLVSGEWYRMDAPAPARVADPPDVAAALAGPPTPGAAERDALDKLLPEQRVRHDALGRALYGSYCAETGLIICENFRGEPRSARSFSELARANLAMLGMVAGPDSWAACEYLAPDGEWRFAREAAPRWCAPVEFTVSSDSDAASELSMSQSSARSGLARLLADGQRMRHTTRRGDYVSEMDAVYRADINRLVFSPGVGRPDVLFQTLSALSDANHKQACAFAGVEWSEATGGRWNECKYLVGGAVWRPVEQLLHRRESL